MPLNNSLNGHCHVIVIGMSSVLGSKIAKQCIANGWDIAGTYRNKNSRVVELEQLCQAAGTNLNLYELDVMQASDVDKICKKLAGSAKRTDGNVSVIYCCGRWEYGDIATLDAECFDNVIGVGLRGPFLVTASALRHFEQGIQLILVTGLGGEKNSIASNTPYSITTNGVYSLVKSVGMELAGKESMCIGVALGLFDKDQAHARALGENLNIGKLPKFDSVANFIVSLIDSRDRMHNGAVIELAGGLFNYQTAIEVFKAVDDK